MTVTSRMFDLATVQRNSETGTDAHGNPLEPSWSFHLTLHCRVYNDSKVLTIDGDKTATVEALRIAFGLGDDVTAADRITEIRDRNGNTLYSGNYGIRQKKRKYSHFAADLKVIE